MSGVSSQFTPIMMLNRLIVSRGGAAVYDQKFYRGVNIIRGDNGSGKSTILDFVFHILGGEVLSPTALEWKEYAGLCDSVVAEVTLNGAPVTLKREVSKERTRPLQMYFGPLETAKKFATEGWQTFPYARQASRESFSQIIFRALNLPEATTPEGSNITIHQVLRLLYSDQMTPVQRIFRLENFDPPILKQAVGDFLCGVGQFDLYEKQLYLRDSQKRFDEINSELKSILFVAGDMEAPLAKASINSEISALTDERTSLYKELVDVSNSDFGSSDESRRRETERRRTSEKVGAALSKTQSVELEIRTLEFEIADSEAFLRHLRKMLVELDRATLTYEQLGGVHFQYCPACFSPTDANSHAEHCHLCKTLLNEAEKAARGLAVKLDLQMQLRESEQLQEERTNALNENKATLRAARREYSAIAAAYDALTKSPISSRDAAIAKINRRLGFIDSMVETLSGRLELVAKIAEMSQAKAALNERISRLQDEIKGIVAAQDKRKRHAYTRISDEVVCLLQQDTGDQDAFVDAKSFSFSFGNDAMFVDGKSNFAASSLVILKNSFHLGLLIASLQDPEFLLPRFMMFDNIEDKGMVPARSWNFQRLICAASAAARVPHQIIFTTSMPASDLDLTAQLIGPAYSKENRTLNIQ